MCIALHSAVWCDDWHFHATFLKLDCVSYFYYRLVGWLVVSYLLVMKRRPKQDTTRNDALQCHSQILFPPPCSPSVHPLLVCLIMLFHDSARDDEVIVTLFRLVILFSSSSLKTICCIVWVNGCGIASQMKSVGNWFAESSVFLSGCAAAVASCVAIRKQTTVRSWFKLPSHDDRPTDGGAWGCVTADFVPHVLNSEQRTVAYAYSMCLPSFTTDCMRPWPGPGFHARSTSSRLIRRISMGRCLSSLIP